MFLWSILVSFVLISTKATTHIENLCLYIIFMVHIGEELEHNSRCLKVHIALFVEHLGAYVAVITYNLDILEENVEDSSTNTTRFLVIGKQSPSVSGDDKTSLCFVVKNRPGALYEALEPFRRNQLQMTLIESRPWQQQPGWEYCFFIDLLGHQDEPKVQDACLELKKNSEFFKILGSYPRIGTK